MEQCVVRECQEELGIVIRPKGLYAQEHYTYGTEPFSFAFFNAEIAEGEPENHVHRAMKGCARRNFSASPSAPRMRGLSAGWQRKGRCSRRYTMWRSLFPIMRNQRHFMWTPLGWKWSAKTTRADRGSYKLDVKLGDCELEIFSFPGSPQRLTRPEACGLRHLAFRVTDIHEAVAELERRGVEVEPIRVDAYTGDL